jgi:hypothetical protein
MKKTQKPIMSRIGAQEYRMAAQGDSVGALLSTLTPRSMRRLARPSYWKGA